jgi:hypothetical protein
MRRSSRCVAITPAEHCPQRWGSLLLALLIAGTLQGPAAAQQLLQFHGWVQWISGTTMVVSTDDGPSVSVDLSRVDQSQYQALRDGAGVTIFGVVLRDRTAVVGLAIRPDLDSDFPYPYQAP